MMYEMYVQIRDVYTANKDGVSVFISTAGTGILSSTRAKGRDQGAAEGSLVLGTDLDRCQGREGSTCFMGLECPWEAQVCPWKHVALISE